MSFQTQTLDLLDIMDMIVEPGSGISLTNRSTNNSNDSGVLLGITRERTIIHECKHG